MLRVLDTLDALSAQAAEEIAATLTGAVRARGTASLGLSGGETPKTLYRLLASTFRDRISWAQIQIFWSDDRYVSPDDRQSNYRLARETLLDRVPCPASNIHPMPTHFADANDAAREYETLLRQHFPHDFLFDVSIMGLGQDGHTASLFPGAAALDEQSRWVLPTMAPAEPRRRLSLTYPALARASHTHVLVSGAEKRDALQRVLAHDDFHRTPAAGLRGNVTWWSDVAAGGASKAGSAGKVHE